VRFTETAIRGAFIIDLEPHADERGFFSRAFCVREFAEHGLTTRISQVNTSFNHLRGTLRGLHYQDEPAPEAKLVRCASGAIFDVLVDMRPGSPTYLQHAAVELSAANRRQLFIPELCAAGYQTLADDTEVTYQVSEFYTPETERGMRYDDPVLGIEWPLPVSAISAKDAAWPLLRREEVRP
jgi:dTDP-4-dehydrorhamnose 3,5-epimerase